MRKIPLLKWSMAFITCFSVNTLLLIFVPFIPSAYSITDLMMQCVLCITCWVYFKHWEVRIGNLIKNKFILMLQSKSDANKISYMARVMGLAKQIVKNCEDETYAGELISEC